MEKVDLRRIVLSLFAMVAILGLAGCGKKIVEQENKPVLKEEVVASKNDNNDSAVPEYKFEKVDTSDWRLYKSEDLGFEVKIPKNWSCKGEEEFGKLGRRCVESDVKDSDEAGLYSRR